VSVKSENNLYNKMLIRPFTYASQSVGNSSLTLAILLSVQIFMLLITKSYSALSVIGCSLAGSLCADAADRLYHKSYHFSDMTSVVQGIIVGMLLPSTFPFFSVFCITFFTMLISKYMFGGFAHAWGNTAVITVAVCWIVGMNAFPGLAVTKDLLQMRNPSYTLIQDGVFPIYKFDPPVTEALNNTIFGVLKVSIPDGYISMLWDTNSIIPAFRFNFITLISSIILFSSGMLSMLIPVCFITSYGLLVRFAGSFICSGIPGQGDLLLAFFTSGTIFCNVFLIQWYGTTPLTYTGKFVYGVMCGIFAFLIAGCGTSSAGMVFTILCANIVSPMIQIIEDSNNRKALYSMLDENLKDEGI
jgi:Na+-translocating ferredoxin:NAD+ oxidoreductase subunit D